MNMLYKKQWFFCVGLAAALALPAQAEEWQPTKPIRLVVPIIGTTNDMLARLVAPKLAEALGQPVVVENRAGAGGLIGANAVARAAPDGYTLLVGNIGPLSISPNLVKEMPFDVMKDFAPITLAMKGAQYIVVSAASGIQSIEDLVSKAKANPDKLSYASVGVGSSSQLTMEMFKLAAGIDLLHVPYKGAEAVTALISGEVQVGVFVPGNVQQYAKDGRLKLLASTGSKRFASAPEVPTMMELGYENFEAAVWGGFLAPAGTPDAVIRRLNREMRAVIEDPTVADKLENIEYEVVTSTPEAFSAYMKQELDRWSNIIKATGIQL